MNITKEMDLQAGRIKDEHSVDQWLVMVVIALLSLGTVMVYSATIAADSKTLEASFTHLIKHLIHLGLGLGIIFTLWHMNLEWIQAASRVILLLGVCMLGLVLIPGVGIEVNGSQRWFDILGVRFQPSEMVKIGVLIYCADYLSRKREDLHLFKVGILNIGLVVGVIGLLLLLEPDFGSLVVISLMVVAMMFLAGVRFLHFAVSVAVAGALMTFLVSMESYRVDRLLSYQDPWVDPFGKGFQLVQALIAVGRGEWFGTGLGGSIQKLFYLPHAGNDFLIALIGEELGAIGILTVLLLFGILFCRAFAIARNALRQGHRFEGFLAQGIGMLMACQAGIHTGVNVGLLPTKGLTLPLMSYGGSSLLSSMLAIGLLFAIDKKCRPKPGRGR